MSHASKDAVTVVTRRRQWYPTPVLLPGKFHGWRSLDGCSPWGRWGSDTTERLHFHFSLSCIGEGNGNQLQCSCVENPRDGEAWWAAIYGVTESRTRLKWLSNSNSNHSNRRRTRRSAATCWSLSGTATLNLGLMDTEDSQGGQALNDTYLYKMARGGTLK